MLKLVSINSITNSLEDPLKRNIKINRLFSIIKILGYIFFELTVQNASND